ncbi:F0F1 ATP synthase subunit epsilon [Saxibacter everestensis]|uniref:ATP synthase epsilon chain n=1 Tax=Saxibacter everestensis TaxID=2909229 RepID=A0ABY8QQ28_9MICO|nr:F0F1 ATP synthase subunit epsilon [Brevibacteriaceae bacterium ZFBP1038]
MASTAELQVDVVAADHSVWSGQAARVVARTAEGEIGILPRHEPLLGVLAEGEVRILLTSGEQITAQAEGGFLSVENNRVTIVADRAELSAPVNS